MTTHRRPFGHRVAGERGAALVEFALIVTMFLVLIFGAIEFGLDYNNYNSVRNGSREGARMGVVNDITNAPSCTINGVTVTPPANPTTAADATNALICKTKDRIGLKSSSTKVQIIAGVNPGDTLKICASYPVGSITGLVAPFVAGKSLVSKVLMRLEQKPMYSSYSGEGTVC
jgi:Flp pilus assembly protein TadG